MSERDTRIDTGERSARLRRCPKCAAEVDRSATMCEFCGALLAPGGRRRPFTLEGVVCFYCGDHNRWSMDGDRCAGCGRPFATTCPRCGEGVPLRHRLCGACGISVEDFDVERARVTVEGAQEKREEERVVWIACRWALVAGLLLMLLGWLVGRRHGELRRPAVALGGLTAGTAATAMGMATAAGTRRRRTEQ
jgi:ribosomal protein L32